MWVTQSPPEVEIKGPHQYCTGKHISCNICSHVPLKNKISQLINRIGCGYRNNVEYKRWVSNGYKF